MSGEKSAEVVGCDASIMKNVWEIREREYRQKMLLEQERAEKSALPSQLEMKASCKEGEVGWYLKTPELRWELGQDRVSRRRPLGRLAGQIYCERPDA